MVKFSQKMHKKGKGKRKRKEETERGNRKRKQKEERVIFPASIVSEHTSPDSCAEQCQRFVQKYYILKKYWHICISKCSSSSNHMCRVAWVAQPHQMNFRHRFALCEFLHIFLISQICNLTCLIIHSLYPWWGAIPFSSKIHHSTKKQGNFNSSIFRAGWLQIVIFLILLKNLSDGNVFGLGTCYRTTRDYGESYS